MIKILFSVLTIIILIIKFGQPTPNMMSIHGDINFVMKTEMFTSDTAVGFMFDDVDGDFAINPLYCRDVRRGRSCFSTSDNCQINAKCGRNSEVNQLNGFDRKHERFFPDHAASSNMLIGVYDEDSPYSATFANGGRAFKFADINSELNSVTSVIQCNDKDETYYRNLFGPSRINHGEIIFTGHDINAYDYSLKCIAELRDTNNQLLTGRAFVLTITNRENNPFSFQSTTIIDPSFFIPTNIEGSALQKINSSIKNNFVFYAINICPNQIDSILSQKKGSNVISFLWNKITIRMPAVEHDDGIACGIRVNIGQTFEYWCDCVSTA